MATERQAHGIGDWPLGHLCEHIAGVRILPREEETNVYPFLIRSQDKPKDDSTQVQLEDPMSLLDLPIEHRLP